MALYAAPCSTKYEAVHHSGERKLSAIRWIVIHSAEHTKAESVAAWFANPKSSGSTHLVVDGTSCFKTLRDTFIPWGAPGANAKGYHIEVCGYARYTRAEWLQLEQTLRRAAYKTAQRCALYNIPARWVGPLGLKLGRKGLTTHVDCSRAFGGDHWDPGPGFPKDTFLAYVRRYLQDFQPEL